MLIFSSRFRELDDLIRRGPFEANEFKFPYDDFIDGDMFPGCRKIAEAESKRYGYDASDEHDYNDGCKQSWENRNALVNYIQEAKPVHTPVMVMALMVAIARKNGYEIRTSKYDYDRNDDFYITPTVGGATIPTGYGANSRAFIVLSDFAQADLAPTSEDDRKGWEYGHSTVITISKVNGEYTLAHNQTAYQDIIRSFPDVNKLVEDYSIDELAHLIGIDSGKFNYAF
jgi:hypothetical protein